MAYSDFTNLDDVESQFGITILSAAPLFRDAKAVPASAPIRYLLEENVSLALNINTEKARSEFIIAPVLVEVRQLLEKKVSLFSGIDFTVDVSCGLNGYCDFLLSYSPDQVFLRAPVACIVEAKNENIKSGYPQCITEMIAARLFNERHRHAVPAILGVVTTGSNWKFLQLQGGHVLIDFDEYLISQVEKILGIFVAVLQQIAPVVAEPAPAADASYGVR
ncbi:MAG: hypothetical protein V3U27_14530 [Candidatus Tectomicrobia bacterium]